ncbi:trypsin-like peptidase domain-containing protein [Calothrix sp. PCC 7507]|uniref:trypsin-like peptidase domain-containing protein n=1 Tax=Calothrix sp. PCC 7507 TaxID=99598 RepID=UPI00029F2021|nr:trypsin-like peptidase domain-containing protein [Calothrix sp. PCC 7507]AFY30833.1 hypothetical protein Cal7507_0336 [Calothrix sp. PCC 7507]
MIIAKIEELLTKIQQLQSIMIAVSTDSYHNPIREKEKLYTKLYREIVDIIEFLAEEGVLIENHNPCKSLSDWRDRWSTLERGLASKGGYVHDLYNTTFQQIDNVLFQHNIIGKSQQQLVDEWQISQFENLIAKIKKLKGIMISVAIQGRTDDLIKAEDEDYRQLYRELTLQISTLQKIGIPVTHPNNFRSLWQWYNHWSFNLDKSYDVRERYIDDLYEKIIKPIERSLNKYQDNSISTEEFLQDLQRRFHQKISVKPSNSSVPSKKVSSRLEEPDSNLEIYHQPEALEQIFNPLSIGVSQAVNDPFLPNLNLTWTYDNAMNPEIFLEQQDVTPLIMALNLFALKVNVASDRQNFLENAGVDLAFLSRLKFDTQPGTFAQSLVSAFKSYQISHKSFNSHPLVNVLKHLCELASLYGLKDQDIELFTRLVEKGQENFRALAVRNTVGRIESPIGNAIGTGVLITKNLLLTSNHIFSKSQVQKAWVRFGYTDASYISEKNIFVLDLITHNSRLDYALCEIKNQTQQQAQAIYSNGNSLLNSGQKIRIIHHPQGNPVIISDLGEIVQVGEDYIDHNLKTDNGSSGAPIFNCQWELIAIHQGNPGIGRTVTPGSTAGIPIRAIWNQISPHLG